MTSSDHDDERLRDAFIDLRARDAASAPGWQEVRDRAPARHEYSRNTRALRIAAAILLVAGIASVVRATRNPDAFTVPPEVIALSRWQATTDVFLEPPAGVLRPTQFITGSLLESSIINAGATQ